MSMFKNDQNPYSPMTLGIETVLNGDEAVVLDTSMTHKLDFAT